jgi:hypothetical protein
MASLQKHLELAKFFAEKFSQYPEIDAVGISGSIMAGQGSPTSDIDLYIFCTSIIPVEERRKIARLRGYSKANFNLQYWDTGDEWFDKDTGIEVDMMHWDRHWIEEQLTKVIDRHESSIGYTTCFWHTIKQIDILFDRHEWLTTLKQKAQAEYPEPLRQNIIQKNYPLLHSIIPAFSNQLEKAVKRGDLFSINHRLTEYLASYFDILFAMNRILHPGEKRLIPFAIGNCPLLPEDFESDITALLVPQSTPDENWLKTLDHFNQAIDRLLRDNGIDLSCPHP